MDDLDGYIDTDGLEPAQWGDRYKRALPYEPERRLVLAIMEDAMHVLGTFREAQTPSGRRIWAEALAWVEDEGNEPFSLAWCCDMLGWDSVAWRERMRHWHGRLPRRTPMGRREPITALRER